MATRNWNRIPCPVDDAPARIWDWRYPQILAGWLQPPLPDVRPPARPGSAVGFSSEEGRRYQLEGWNASEPELVLVQRTPRDADLRRGRCPPQVLRLRSPAGPTSTRRKLTRQRVSIRLNGRPVGDLTAADTALRDLPVLPPRRRVAVERTC